MELRKLFKTYRQILISLGVIIVSVLCFLLGVFPLAQKTAALWTNMGAITSDIKTLTGKTAVLQGLDETTLKKNLLDLTNAVPADQSIGSIFTTLDGVAGNAVTVQDFQLTKVGSIATDSAKKLSADENKLGAHIMPFSITVTGGYGQIQTFLTEVIAVRRLFGIRAVDISLTAGNADVRVNLDAYYFPLPTAIGGVTQPIAALDDKQQATLTKVTALPLQGIYELAVASPSATGKDDPFSP